MHFLWFLIIGLVAGWLAHTIMSGRGAGLIMNLVVGVVAAYLGGWLFGQLEWHMPGTIGSLVTATVGAVILLFLVGLIRRR